MSTVTLTPEQLAPVHSRAEHRVIRAGAGTGKTATLVGIISNLLNERGRSAECITAISFTRAASRELRERVEREVGWQAITYGTSHSLALKILRSGASRLGMDAGFGIYDEADEDDVRRALAGIYGVSQAAIKDAVKDLRTSLKDADLRHSASAIAAAKQYEADLKSANVVDMDQILHLACRVLAENPELHSRWSYTCRILIVDEYHDTSPEESMLYLLLGPDETVVVGDEQQCIYGFRGTSNEFLSLAAARAGSKVFLLTQSWRSCAAVVAAANNVVTYAAQQCGLVLRPRPGLSGRVRLMTMETDWVDAVRQAAAASRSVGVIARTNLGVERAMESLRAAAIPAETISTERPFYREPAVRAFHAILRARHNPSDARAAELVLSHQLARLTSDHLADAREVAVNDDRPVLEVLNWRGLTRSADLASLADWAKEELCEIYRFNGLDHRARLVEIAHGRVSEWLADDPKLTLEDFLSWLVYREVVAERRVANKPRAQVECSTAHGAKGLEWDTVVVTEVDEGAWPHKRAKTPEQQEEERRLFYVAITRARTQLVVVVGQPRPDARKIPRVSRFVQEIFEPSTAGSSGSPLAIAGSGELIPGGACLSVGGLNKAEDDHD